MCINYYKSAHKSRKRQVCAYKSPNINTICKDKILSPANVDPTQYAKKQIYNATKKQQPQFYSIKENLSKLSQTLLAYDVHRY